jgi:Cd2+/Zn2+-exporting ATPase
VRFKFYHLKGMVTAAEEYFTSRSMVDVKELKENYPDFALVLDMTDDNLPNTSDLEYKRVPVHDVEVGSYIFVGAGEVCDSSLIAFSFCSIISIH